MMKINKKYKYKKLTNVCLINNLETIERNHTKENKCIIKGKMKNILEI